MNTHTEETLKELFRESVQLSHSFKKKTYEDLFHQTYKKYQDFFTEMNTFCKEAEDTQSAIEEFASVLPDYAQQELMKISKHARNNRMVDYNMAMVTYVIPLFIQSHEEFCEKISEEIIRFWNEYSPKMMIKSSTFEQINGGFKTNLCYITTAVCESLHKVDDCYELTLLRDYRDEYLVYQEDGEAIIKEYYDIAPTIVKRIDQLEHSEDIYRGIWSSYLEKCVHLIEQNRFDECKDIYSNMVRNLQKEYLYS
ncbi:MAG: CFI-box-CTERM domain-containing protein [Lachnospiraceae bacterium]